jgi:hypothetical protein
VEKIYIGLASYRDHDLINTIKSFYNNAACPSRLFFSIVSYEDSAQDTPLDLSFIPEEQYSYQRVDYRLALGACKSRHLANSLLTEEYTYFVQADAHSRLFEMWDEIAIWHYKRCSDKWGEDYLFTKYPPAYEVKWEGDVNVGDVYLSSSNYLGKVVPEWQTSLWLLTHSELEDSVFGDLSIGFSANCVFGSARAMLKIPYDPFLYFSGEEPTLGVRAYVNGVNLVAPPFNFMWTNYNRENGRRKQQWDDDNDWWVLDKYSRNRQADFYSGKNLGIYGITDLDKYRELQETHGYKFGDPELIAKIRTP